MSKEIVHFKASPTFKITLNNLIRYKSLMTFCRKQNPSRPSIVDSTELRYILMFKLEEGNAYPCLCYAFIHFGVDVMCTLVQI